jgi:hypothetical protein
VGVVRAAKTAMDGLGALIVTLTRTKRIEILKRSA